MENIGAPVAKIENCSENKGKNNLSTNKIKVVLLGDSIRQIGYGKYVENKLGDSYQVFQPEDNSRFVQYVLRQIFEYNNEIVGADIVHFNVGLWDVCDIMGDNEPFTPIDVYVNYVIRIAKNLKARCKTVIFSTTTPVLPQNPYNKNEVIKKFNDAVVPELKKIGVIVNDLFTLIYSDLFKYISSVDFIHLTDEGVVVAGDMISDLIKSIK